MRRWHSLLYERFSGQPLPLLHAGGETWTAASLWAGSRRWVAHFRALGLAPGDRLLLALPAGPGFVQVLLAALWESLTIVPVPMGERVERLQERLDARVVVSLTAGAATIVPSADHGPPESVGVLRAASGPPTPSVRFLLRTSGTTGAGRWIALGDESVLAVLKSHQPLFGLEGAIVLSVLPWQHVFGLVLDLLASLLAGAEIVRDGAGGRDPVALLALSATHPVTHLNAVPLVLERLRQTPGGTEFLEGLRGGLVGGAPVRGSLVQVLARTRLRVGYGQTEASPGVCVGDAGAWHEATIGRPVGCEVRVDAEGELHFRGPNASLGTWEAGGLLLAEPDRWVASGDLVAQEAEGTLTYLGRRSADFKLGNGRMVAAVRFEAELRRTLPALQEVALGSINGAELDVWLSVAEGTAAAAVNAAIDAGIAVCLGAPASWSRRVHHVPLGDWPRSSKGEVDRAALERRTRDAESSAAH